MSNLSTSQTCRNSRASTTKNFTLMRLIDMFILLIFCYLNNTFCAEMPNDFSTTESIISLSFENQNEKKQNISTKTVSEEHSLELMNHVKNLNKLYKFINANNEQSRNEKLKILLNILKIELTNVNNKFNRVNFKEFLNNSIELIDKFDATNFNESDRDDEIVLHETIEKFILELENIDKLLSSFKKFDNMNFLNLMLIKYKFYSYKRQVGKLREAFAEYIDFLNKNNENLISNSKYLSTKLRYKFNEMKLKLLLISEVETEKLPLIFHDNLYANVSDLYEELIDYFNQEHRLLERVFINCEDIWKFLIKHLETYGQFF